MPPLTHSDSEALIHGGYRYAMALCHDPHLASDLVQDAWLACLRAGATPNVSYFQRAVRSRFIDHCRRPHLRLDDEAVTLAAAAETEDPIQDWPQEIQSQDLTDCLQHLRDSEREALFLMVVEGHSAQQAAEIMDCARGTVLSLVHRSKAKLREALLQRQRRKAQP